MQIGLGFLLSLGAFQAAMFAALCAFVPPKNPAHLQCADKFQLTRDN